MTNVVKVILACAVLMQGMASVCYARGIDAPTTHGPMTTTQNFQAGGTSNNADNVVIHWTDGSGAVVDTRTVAPQGPQFMVYTGFILPVPNGVQVWTAGQAECKMTTVPGVQIGQVTTPKIK